VREHTLAGRLHASVWIAKIFVVPASMYASQVWGTGIMQTGERLSGALQLNILTGLLVVKWGTSNWPVLRGFCLQPLQYNLFRAAIKLMTVCMVQIPW